LANTGAVTMDTNTIGSGCGAATGGGGAATASAAVWRLQVYRVAVRRLACFRPLSVAVAG
jgi:hypothetical protein